MAQACTQGDQGSLGGLCWQRSLAGCRNRKEAVNKAAHFPALFPTFLHFCLHSVQPLGLPSLHFWKPPALLETSLNIFQTLFSAPLHLSQPSCTSSNALNSLHFNSGVPLPTFIVLAYSPIPFFLLSFIISPSLSSCSTTFFFCLIFPQLPFLLSSGSSPPSSCHCLFFKNSST